MHKYQILIEYVGTSFVGWQIQSKGKSIQKLIQTKLSRLLKEKILLVKSMDYIQVLVLFLFIMESGIKF